MRTIRTEWEVDEALNKALEKWPRADEVWEAMIWAIARDATVGTALSESGAVRSYTIQGAQSVGWPTLTVAYRIENSHVTFYEARFEDAKAPQAGRA